MTTETDSNQSTQSGDGWFKALIRPILDSFERNPCNATAYELGLESSLVVYFATAYGFKRKESAFRYSMIAFFFVPLIAWPICAVKTAKEKQDQLTPREL